MTKRIFNGPQERQPHTITNRTVSGALLPATAVFVGATTLTQATNVSGGRLALLANRDFYADPAQQFTSTDPLLTAYASGDTGVALELEKGFRVTWAMAAGTYTNGQELTVAASGRLAAAASTNVVVAFFDQAGATLSAGALADVSIANFYTKA